jgi:cyclopropane-fatty-acyl-phospholipid synthase
MNQTPNPTNHKPLLMIDKAAPSAAVSHPAITLPAEADYGRYGLSARIILSALSRMALGRLRFQMPDGKEWIFGGAQPEFAALIQVKHLDFFKKVVLYGDVGFGESYVDGDWDTDDISRVISFFILNIENWPTLSGTRRKGLFLNLFHHLQPHIHFH